MTKKDVKKNTDAKDEKALAEVPSTPMATGEIVGQPQSPEFFITMAIQRGLPVETMERLLVMRDKIKAEQAKEAFVEAMATFQGDCPVVTKDKVVMNKGGNGVRYKYAPLDSIVEQVRPVLARNGLSFTVDAIQEQGFVTAVCKVTHKLGHSETSSFKVPIDTDSYMSSPQRFAAALTFAKRYAFCNALGILTGDEDNDADPQMLNTQAAAQHQEARGRAPYQGRPNNWQKPAAPAVPPPPPKPVDPKWDNIPCPSCGEGIMQTVAFPQAPEKWVHKCSMFGKPPKKCRMVIRIGEDEGKVLDRVAAMNEPQVVPVADDGSVPVGNDEQEPPVDMTKLNF